MKSYRIPRSRVVYEVLNTEVILIDFDTGTYYALAHVAKQVWQLIEHQIPLDQIAQRLSNHYKCEFGKVLADVQQLIELLLENNLLELSSEADGSQGSADSIEIDNHGWPYDLPRLQKYTDVQNLLFLDPIHEVSEVGWPEKLG